MSSSPCPASSAAHPHCTDAKAPSLDSGGSGNLQTRGIPIMTDQPTPEPDPQPQRRPSYQEVPPSLQEYLTAPCGNTYIAMCAWELPTVEHPQGRGAWDE